MKRTYLIVLSLIFIALAILPLLSLLFGSLFRECTINLDNYIGLIQGRTLQLLLQSILIGVAVCFLSTILGLGFGFLLIKSHLPNKALFKVLLLIPLLLPSYITAVAWVDFFVFLGISSAWIYSRVTAIFVLTLIYTPLAVLIFSAALQNINAGLEGAALLITNYRKVFFTIILPLIKPAVFSSLLLIFILSISEFSVPAFLSVDVLTTDIFIQFSAFYNYNVAIAQSSLLILLCVIGLIIERKLLADTPFLTVTGKSHHSRLAPVPQATYVPLALAIGYVLFSIIIPLAVLIAQSLAGGRENFYKALSYLWVELGQSLLFAITGAAIIAFVGFSFAYLKARRSYGWIDFMLMLTFAIPSVVAGIALINYYNTPFSNFIYATPAIIFIAYLMRFVLVAERILNNRLIQLPQSLEHAASICGAGNYLTLRKITLPLMSEALMGAFIISFIFCIGELGTIIMVYPPGTALLPIKIFTIMANAPQSLTSAMCLIVLLFTTSVLGGILGLWQLIKRARFMVYDGS
ncbi:iron ABC transporter permease [Rhodocytophaga aerolata]|uniref:Iron ABC transporter permease n=1 Tax=Rhodocytophaga aerolata TaxID=455078 RepID=A0ABT8REJ4_9BACT|nr:iron ABC transporter permease [Rhodocytophaga aerolata]MDO1449608.1 iron ABC transporter permease [Rhodocytophaga aerolata]